MQDVVYSEQWHHEDFSGHSRYPRRRANFTEFDETNYQLKIYNWYLTINNDFDYEILSKWNNDKVSTVMVDLNKVELLIKYLFSDRRGWHKGGCGVCCTLYKSGYQSCQFSPYGFIFLWSGLLLYRSIFRKHNSSEKNHYLESYISNHTQKMLR